MSSSTSIMRRLSDSDAPNSLGNKLRTKRFSRFEALVSQLPRPLRILDVGGTNTFWENRGWDQHRDVEILTLNLHPEERRHERIIPVVGDATDLSEFADRCFDVVFSNSVIEHLFTFENQRQMASEIQRVGKTFWVQTPNYWFPMEPHFHILGWQWMPVETRTSMLQHHRCGWRGPCSNRAEARRLVEEVRLLTAKELRMIFPTASLVAERFCGFVKSWTAIGGFGFTRPN